MSARAGQANPRPALYRRADMGWKAVLRRHATEHRNLRRGKKPLCHGQGFQNHQDVDIMKYQIERIKTIRLK